MIIEDLKKEKLFLLLITIILACIIISFIVLNERKVGSKMDEDIAFFEHISERKILKIELREAIDLPEYVEFSDDDLIEETISYLKSIKIKSLSKHSKDTNGGNEVIKIYFADSGKVIVQLSENEMKFKETNYLIGDVDKNILHKIYQKSVERGYLNKNN